RYGVGAKSTVTTMSGSQIREIRAGNNYVSQNPLEVHVGLGAAQVADVTVLWPDGMESFLDGVSADQLLTVVHPDND
ncbi:MAG: ASPIC/UnbV domain-containing protein, partial [Gammaproteobacteria bacterium]|nr:ASPIC/UnbV domain-containing protein [Gammaproteobacteria bacterium]